MTDAPKAVAEMPALKPCPFCGGEAELWQAHSGRKAWVACMGRCAVLVTAEHQTNEEAIATWNNRALPAEDAEMVARQHIEALLSLHIAHHNNPVHGAARAFLSKTEAK